MVSCTFISVLTQMYEWWYGKSSTLAIRNAYTASHVHVHILACHILTSKKTTSVETLSGVFTSVHDFYCSRTSLGFFPKSAWFLHAHWNTSKDTCSCKVASSPFLCFQKNRKFKEKDVLNSKKRSHDVPSQMCWIPRKDLMTYHPRCVEFQEKISWHNIPDVLNSKKRSHDITSQMCWIPRKDLMTYHPRCVEFQEKISWHNIPDVLNSKKRSHDVPSQMCWIPRKDLMTYHPRCVEFQEKISWHNIPDVLNSKKRSHDITSQMCWIPRKDLMTYHPRCVEFQEKISWHNIPDVLKSKERYYTPPPTPHPPPPQPTPRQKKQQKKTKKGFTGAKR